jgi:starch synthase
MDILLAASEFAPWVQRTGVSEVVASFSKTLKQIGHATTVVVPYHSAYDQAGLLLARRLSKLKVPEGRELSVYDTQLTSGVQLVLLDLGAEETSAPEQAVVFAQAVAALINDRSNLGAHTDIVHVQDSLGSLVALAIEQIDGPRPPTVVTLQDGVESLANAKGQSAQIGSLDDVQRALQSGEAALGVLSVRTAKAVITPSHAQARALVEPQNGSALLSQLRQEGKPIVGIPVGVEYGRANPATDPQLPVRFDAEDASHKAVCKGTLQKQLGLDVSVSNPLLLIAGPLTGDAGRTVVELLPRLLDYSLSVVVATQPGDDQAVIDAVCRLANDAKSRVATLVLNNGQPHTPSLAAADFALLGDASSPLSIVHLFALRYGAAAIANLAGYYSDQLVDCDAKLETGNCFGFGSWNATEVLGAISRAVTAWAQPSFERLRRRMMRQDVGWERPTRRSLQVYRQVLGIKV